MDSTALSASPSPTGFERDATQVVGRLIVALNALLQQVAQARQLELARAADLQRAFSIDPKLAWQIFRSTRASSPLEAALTLPVVAALHRFVRAAQTRGAGPTIAKRASAAIDAFEVLVRTHADDRDAFDALVASVIGEEAEDIGAAYRESVYRATSFFHGLNTQVRATCIATLPTERWKTFDMMFVRGYYGLGWQRPRARFALNRLWVRPPSGPNVTPVREALDPAAEAAIGAPVIPELCSKPLPAFETTELEPDHRLVEIVGDDIGSRTRRDYVLAEVFRNQQYRGGPRDEPGHRIWVAPPCRTLIYDTLLHQSHGQQYPIAEVWNGPSGLPATVPQSVWERCATRLPIKPSVRYLGAGDSGLALPDTPGYLQTVRTSLGKLGWPIDEFDVYRVSIEYPLCGSVVVIKAGNVPQWGL